jgi:uncharacterized membrane protein
MVGAPDRFCTKCGAAQPVAPPGPAGSTGSARPDLTGGVSHHTASMLCYVPWLGWIAAVFVLASDRFRRDHQVRFHAFQGLYLFVAWLVAHSVLMPVIRATDVGFGFPFPRMAGFGLELLVLVAWVVMLIKVSHNENYRLPIIGEWAERSVSEQRT